MFSQLGNFGYKRTALQAVGFYIAYLVFTIITAALAGMVLGGVTGNNDFEFGKKVGIVVAIVMTLVFSFLILQAKKMTNNYMYLLLAVVAGILSFVGGGLLGLIIPAYLTTRGSDSSSKKKGKK
jgi:MFS family permease